MSAAEMREALKPCPFCGGEAAYRADHTTEHVDSISCRRCDFYMSDPGIVQGSVRAAWNRRAPLPDEEGMVERVARAICEAPPRTVETADGTTVELAGCPEPGACKLCSYGALAAIRAINGGEP